jgi:hypothetical protein
MKNKWLSIPEYVRDLLGALAVGVIAFPVLPMSWPWQAVAGFAFLAALQFTRYRMAVAQFEARGKRAGAERIPIVHGYMPNTGNNGWICDLPSFCGWMSPIGHRRPVHTRKQHERLLKEAGK